MLKLNNQLNKIVLNEKIGKQMTQTLLRALSRKPVSEQRRLAKPRSQIKGVELLRNPGSYKGMAFSIEERQILGIQGLIPPAVLSQDVQALRIMTNFLREQSDLDRYIALINLQDRNEKLFYKVIMDNLEQMLPIVYTPTVGLACQKYGVAFRRSRGLFITIHDKGHIYDVLSNWPEQTVKAIVVTDGERILGLGDLGCYGMGIPVGKLSLYTALAGIPPSQCLPIMLDVGTNNQELLDDPLYIGLRQKRAPEDKYKEFMDEFMEAVVAKFGPDTLIQYEDFASHHAYNFLQKYRNDYCMFNDDIQGTAAVALSGVLASLRVTGMELEDSKILFVGAGQAACGIADLMALAVSKSANITFEEACESIYMVDVDGLLVDSRKEGDLVGPKQKYVKKSESSGLEPSKDLVSIIDQIKPTCLIGATGVASIFTPQALRKMGDYNERPLIFALSNPTSKAECTAEQAYVNTDGRALFSSGSPFAPVVYNDKTFYPGQGNNAYIFPGVALATIVAQSRTIEEEVFLIAATALSNQVSEKDLESGRLYPPLKDIREVSVQIAVDIMNYYYKEHKATLFPKPENVEQFLRQELYSTEYESYLPSKWNWPAENAAPRKYDHSYFAKQYLK